MSHKSSSRSPAKTAVNHRRQRLQKVLTTLLSGTEHQHDDLKQIFGFVRNWDLPRMYAWCERVSAVAYDTPEVHFSVAQVAALISKAPFNWRDFGFDMHPRERAKVKFDDAERRCRITNRRFVWISLGRYARRNIPLEKLEKMRSFIHRVLGESPDLGRILDLCSFGPGAALGVHGNATNLYRKFFAESWTVNPMCLPYAIPAVMRNASFFHELCEERNGIRCYDEEFVRKRITERLAKVSSNKVSFVPKTAKTERSIAVEPLLNSLVQKGIDLYMRECLVRYGYDLTNQAKNAWLAKVGSETGQFGTLDLSSASDTVSVGLVRYLLPPDWLTLLERTRSPSFLRDGAERRNAKFASMGNGFCFPLETLIFAAALRACNDDHIEAGVAIREHSVYGDDIVVPFYAFDSLVKLLRFLGFVPNESKSFNEGPFRESCGSDWYRGLDVRPVYVDYPLSSTREVMKFHNVTLRSGICSDFFKEVRPMLRDMVPPRERLMRPFEAMRQRWVGDLEVEDLEGAFSVPQDVFLASPNARWCRNEQRWTWKEFVYKPLLDKAETRDFNTAQYWALLLGSPQGELHLRRQTKRLIVKR